MKFTIIICTYNARRDYLERVLGSCFAQDFTIPLREIVLVDNNSREPVAGLPYIRPYLAKGLTVIRESKQGLAFARLAGFLRAAGEVIVFVDDDNVLDSGYLSALEKLTAEHPEVGAWGPGSIKLDYTEGAPAWVRENYGGLLQEKSLKETRFGNEKGWPAYYPSGSGLAVRRNVLEVYMQKFESGTVTARGRSGETLTSGEDSQIVWTAITLGLHAGTSPQLKLTHLIPAARTTVRYLSSLNRAIAASYRDALIEMFPGEAVSIKKRSLPGRIRLILQWLAKSNFEPIGFYRRYLIENAWYKGMGV